MYRSSRDSPSCERGIIIHPDFDVDRRHVRRMILQSEKLAASASARAVLDGLARHGCEIAQEVATRSTGDASFLSTRDTRSNSGPTFDSRRAEMFAGMRGGFRAGKERRTFVTRICNPSSAFADKPRNDVLLFGAGANSLTGEI